MLAPHRKDGLQVIFDGLRVLQRLVIHPVIVGGVPEGVNRKSSPCGLRERIKRELTPGEDRKCCQGYEGNSDNAY